MIPAGGAGGKMNTEETDHVEVPAWILRSFRAMFVLNMVGGLAFLHYQFMTLRPNPAAWRFPAIIALCVWFSLLPLVMKFGPRFATTLFLRARRGDR